MSYDLEVAVKVEGCDKYAMVNEPTFCNPTYNLREMFEECMNWDYKQGVYYKCSEYLPKLNEGIRRLKTEDFSRLNPSNGWGNQKTAIEALTSWRDCICESAEYIPLECLYMRW